MTDEQLHIYCETVADIAYDMGYRRLRLSNNSREKIGQIVGWGKEFNEKHENTNWLEVGYLDKIEEFIHSKLSEHFVNVDNPCPHCGKASSLHCEFVDDEQDYLSIQCFLCGQYWEGESALTALSGVSKWEKEIIGDDARAVLKTLLLDVEPARQLYGVLKHPKCYCQGVYQDGDKFVAFDNSRGECFIEEFEKMNPAIKWMRGEIEIEDRDKYE